MPDSADLPSARTRFASMELMEVNNPPKHTVTTMYFTACVWTTSFRPPITFRKESRSSHTPVQYSAVTKRQP